MPEPTSDPVYVDRKGRDIKVSHPVIMRHDQADMEPGTRGVVLSLPPAGSDWYSFPLVQWETGERSHAANTWLEIEASREVGTLELSDIEAFFYHRNQAGDTVSIKEDGPAVYLLCTYADNGAQLIRCCDRAEAIRQYTALVAQWMAGTLPADESTYEQRQLDRVIEATRAGEDDIVRAQFTGNNSAEKTKWLNIPLDVVLKIRTLFGELTD